MVLCLLSQEVEAEATLRQACPASRARLAPAQRLLSAVQAPSSQSPNSTHSLHSQPPGKHHSLAYCALAELEVLLEHLGADRMVVVLSLKEGRRGDAALRSRQHAT